VNIWEYRGKYREIYIDRHIAIIERNIHVERFGENIGEENN